MNPLIPRVAASVLVDSYGWKYFVPPLTPAVNELSYSLFFHDQDIKGKSAISSVSVSEL